VYSVVEHLPLPLFVLFLVYFACALLQGRG
jgi:hypothetical protein